MNGPFNPDRNENIRRKIIGLGDSSIHKSYYPELQQRLGDLERFKALVNASHNYICTISTADGIISEANLVVARAVGKTPDDLRGESFFSTFPSLDRQQIFQMLEATRKDPEHAPFVLKTRNVQGIELLIETTVSIHTWDDVEYAVLIGQEISQRVKAENRIQRQLQRLAYLHQIDLAITAYLNIGETMKQILEISLADLRPDAICISVIDDKTFTLLPAAWYGFPEGSASPGEIPHLFRSAEMIQQWREQSSETGQLIIQQLMPADLIEGYPYQVYLSVPLITEGKMKGLFEIYRCESERPDMEWFSFLDAICTQTAIAIDHIQVVDGLRTFNRELQQTYDATLEGWALALELREKETSQHTHRVTQLTVILARELGFSEEEIVHIRRGALLHDIGKMGIPDFILLKPGPLTPEEWAVMRKHPTYARDMIEPIPFLRPAIIIPYYHHERWNGSGYPYGLKGEAIPLAARMFAVIDVWDALLSDRPYRQAWSHEKVIDYLSHEAGVSFDPKIVDTFLSLIAKKPEELALIEKMLQKR